MPSHIVLISPLLIVITLFATRNLNMSFIAGIISASLIAGSGSITHAASLIYKHLSTQCSDIHYVYMYGFLILIGMLIMLLNQSGGADAFAASMTRTIKSKKSVQTTSLLISSLLFIDDYLSNLTVGCVIKPVSDLFKIPRAKLAYLVHAMSGPLVILVPISSWVAMITGQLDNAGINQHITSKISADPFLIYIATIPFIFYSLFTILSAWIIVQGNISFGPMHTHEVIAKKTGNLWGGKHGCDIQCSSITPSQESKPIDLIFPIAFLMLCIFLGILISGDYWLFGGSSSFFQAFKNNTNSFLIFFVSSAITFTASSLFACIRGTIVPREIPLIMRHGFDLMKGAIITLFLASLLGLFLKNELALGSYFAELIHTALPIFAIPAILFVISSLIAILTGTSWGTIALMLPVSVQLLCSLTDACSGSITGMPLLLPTLGAIFSGAVCGDHISPLSETTIMAATSSGSYPLDHAYTQIFYALPSIVITTLSFLLIGFLMPHYGALTSLTITLGIGIIALTSILFFKNKR